MVVKAVRQGCVVLLMGKPPYLLPHQPLLIYSSDTAAQLRITVGRVANLNLASALEPRSTSAGTCNSMDTSFVAADFNSEAESIEEFRERTGWPVRSLPFTQSRMTHDVYGQNDAVCLLFSRRPPLAEAVRVECMPELR